MAMAAPSSIDLSPSRKRDDYVRLARLIISGGTTVLRALFDAYHPPADLAKKLNNAKFKSDLKSAGLTAPQRQILYPGSGDPVSKNFDLSLLYKLLRNICGLHEPACKWNGCPLDGDISLEDDIVRLRNYRNEVYGHVSSEMAISSEDFTKYWEDISEALIRINNKIPNKIDPRILDKEMSKLKVGPITQDEKYDILQEIQETLNEHTEALGRIENQGDGLCKQVECLQDTFNQTAFQQTQAPAKSDLNMKNTTTQIDNNIHINIINNSNTNINININNKSNKITTNNNFLNTNPLQEKLGLGVKAIEAPPGFPPLPASLNLMDKRTISCPSSGNSSLEETDKYKRSFSLFDKNVKSNDLRTSHLKDDFEQTSVSDDIQGISKSLHQEQEGSVYSNVEKRRERDSFQFARSQTFPTRSQQPKSYVYERRLSLRDPASDFLMGGASPLSRDLEETFLADNQQVNKAFQQEQDGKYSFEEDNTERINIRRPSSRPEGNHEPSAFQEYCAYPRGERPRSGEKLNPFEPSLAQACSPQTTNHTNQNIGPQSNSYFPEENSPPTTVPRYHGNVSRRRSYDDWRFPNDQSDENVHFQTRTPLFSNQNSTTMSQLTSPYTDESSRRRSSSLEDQERCTPKKPPYSNFTATNKGSFEDYNRSGRRDQALSHGDLPFQELAPNDGRVLHINIRICGNRNPGRLHLGQLISQSLTENQTDGQFRSYLMQSKQLTIEKVEYQDDIHCCIGVSADDLESLENIWRDYVTHDLREIIKETVLPSDFDGELEVTIDGKEYEQCCKRLTPKDLGEMRSYHSQSFDVNQTQEEDVDFSPRWQSLGELSSSSKRAFDELYLLLCKHGGKLQYTEVIKKLSQNGRTEIEKAMIQKNMDTRFRILPGSFIQARLNFCAKKSCATKICPNLHLCRYNLLAGCTFPDNCKNSHDITDPHTNRIFRDANLSSLTAEKRSNLLKNIAYTVPEICRFYNTPGNISTCKHNDHCRYLHVCKHWVNGKCLFNKPNKKCSRAHTFDNPTTQKILKESNLLELSEEEVKLKLLKQNI